MHGFTQTAASWSLIATAFAEAGCEVICPDAPGHGRSGAVAADLVAGADLLAQCGGRAVYIGYSMGGRLALHTALRHPELVEGLILLGATAGIDAEAERTARRVADELLADELERDGIDLFLVRWLANPLFATLQPDPGDLAARRTNTVRGLASSLRLAGTGAQEPLWDRLAVLTMPVLLLAGERDPKFLALAERMAVAIGENTSLGIVADAGHAAHLERPDAFVEHVRRFLEEAMGRRR